MPFWTNFVNPDFFHPQPVTPSYTQRNYVGTLIHNLGLLGGTLVSSTLWCSWWYSRSLASV